MNKSRSATPPDRRPANTASSRRRSVDTTALKDRIFDQFYTQDSVAEHCLDALLKVLAETSDYRTDTLSFIEPSAGDGAFLRALEKSGHPQYYACDVDPHHPKIAQRDFLLDNLAAELPPRPQTIVIGNPPFGRRASLAAQFVNRAFTYSETVAFILPLQFQRYSAQAKLLPAARLIFDTNLAPESFIFKGKAHSVRCCFQIWTTRPFGRDLRLRSAPATTHPDFEMWQYNNTREAEKYFDQAKYQWDFAVPRQGYKDYSQRATDPATMDHRTQWIFFKASTPEILDRLNRLDYTRLSNKNISIPGFGKADVVAEYVRLYGSDGSFDSPNSNNAPNPDPLLTCAADIPTRSNSDSPAYTLNPLLCRPDPAS